MGVQAQEKQPDRGVPGLDWEGPRLSLLIRRFMRCDVGTYVQKTPECWPGIVAVGVFWVIRHVGIGNFCHVLRCNLVHDRKKHFYSKCNDEDVLFASIFIQQLIVAWLQWRCLQSSRPSNHSPKLRALPFRIQVGGSTNHVLLGISSCLCLPVACPSGRGPWGTTT